MRTWIIALLAAAGGGACAHGEELKPAATGVTAVAPEDAFAWLEPTEDAKALAWVKAQDARTLARYAADEAYTRLRDRILEVYDSDARIPYVSRRGEHLYNFWQDADHPRGLWRRTTLDEYAKDAPRWETLLDVDALGAAEGKRWVFKGVDCLEPDHARCLLFLSPDGGDAFAVREFDVPSRTFVEDGFVLPSAKTVVSWIDRDHLFVGTDFGPGAMTKSSYPRIAKAWTRGTPLSAATEVYAGLDTDLEIVASHDPTPGFERDIVLVVKDFYHAEAYLLRDGALTQIPTPTDAEVSAKREWLLIKLRSPWTVGAETYPAGALLATRLDAFMAGERELDVLFQPDAHTALSTFAWTRHHLILDILADVKSRLEVLTPGEDGWQRAPLEGAPGLSTVSLMDTDPDHSDEYWLGVTGFLTPPSLSRGVLGEGAPTFLKQQPALFDASGLEATQHFATSKDGTRVPYFQIGPKDAAADGAQPTLLYGYGGFEISLLPRYNGAVGRAWLERGGVYVIANIRGGGEYGPSWHDAALKDKRHRAYEDFAAVAGDLVARGVTSPAHLAAEGGSNGGLLVGNMLTDWPERFGAIACEVPLLDMKRYTHLSAGTSWIAEYGDPDKPEEWAFIQTFSPYHKLADDVAYPPTLFYTATSDDRVGPAQARKMAAKMLAMGKDQVYFFENTEGGHSAGADHAQQAEMHALAYTFMWEHVK
ncbi:MAG: S9 family peptidase [Deltaproteobacteria bacterium]|nr:MAG: S9 family peptidase [Deltaproteobacteria bacterium]